MDFNLEDYEEEKNFILNNPATPTLKLMRDFAKQYHKKQLTLTNVVSTSNCDFCGSEIGTIKKVCHVCIDEMQDRD